MTEREVLIQKIGEHVVSCFEAWTKKRVGTSIVALAEIPRERSPREIGIVYPRLGDWQIMVSVSAPTLICITGPNDHKILSPEEALEVLEK